MSKKSCLDRAIEVLGNQNRLAVALGVTRNAVYEWVTKRGGMVPLGRALDIERVTGGAVKAKEVLTEHRERRARKAAA